MAENGALKEVQLRALASCAIRSAGPLHTTPKKAHMATRQERLAA